MPSSKVIDAWALMAWVQNEFPAAKFVRSCIEQAELGELQLLMSWINVGEVYYMVTRKRDRKTADELLARLPTLPIRLFLPNEQQILEASKIKSSNKLSYADAFAVALAIQENGSLITGDPEIRAMSKSHFKVDWIGSRIH